MRLRTFLGIALVAPVIALAHGGGLNKQGCHTNHKTGDYHCHGNGFATRGVMPLSGESNDADSRDDRALIKTAQTLLRAIGYTPGEFGSLDEMTRAAIQSFQSQEGLEKSGEVSPILLLRLAQAAVHHCGKTQ